MSWRIVVITSNAKLDFKMDYLVVRNLEETKRIHISEIAVLILESTAISITAYAISELVKRKVRIIFCDGERNPQAQIVPSHGCHDSSAKIREQIKWKESAKQAVWTEIVREKIKNQRDFLQVCGKPQADLLSAYLQELKLNDETNREGHAAKVYFNALWGMEFSRALPCPENAALNYGYSLLLSAVNRQIAAAGYLSQIGLFHDNTFNPFNLGCDLMEPLRPLVDQCVYQMQMQSFEKEEKAQLVKLLAVQVKIDGWKQFLLNAIRIYCASVFKAIESGDISEIRMIEYELPVHESNGLF